MVKFKIIPQKELVLMRVKEQKRSTLPVSTFVYIYVSSQINAMD